MTDSQTIFNMQIDCPFVSCRHAGAVGEFVGAFNIDLEVGQMTILQCSCPKCKSVFNIKIKAVKQFEITRGQLINAEKRTKTASII